MSRIPKILGIIAIFFVCSIAAIDCPICEAQDSTGWWGSNHWFDWSDFRGRAIGRAYLARLTSGSVTPKDHPAEMLDPDLTGSRYNMTRGPEIMKELTGEVYIDRLGFRLTFDELSFRGMSSEQILSGITGIQRPLSELKLVNSRIGLDLDVVRYPFFRLGFNYDYQFEPIVLHDRTVDNNGVNSIWSKTYTSLCPMTIGLHALAIPARIRNIPIMAEARVRSPIPGLSRQGEARITDWEISGGIRPAIWDMSPYGYSTFSPEFMAGYRSVNIDAEGVLIEDHRVNYPDKIDLKAHWQGPFIQVGIAF